MAKESFKSRSFRWWMNLFPAYRGSGARVTHIAEDWKEVGVKVPLNWRTRNYVGTIFGGSMYAAVDPVYMIMFIKLLGTDYIVWDKAAEIQFKKPGRSTLFATFRLSDEELDQVRQALDEQRKLERRYSIDLVDSAGTVCASVDKLLYFRRKGSGKERSS